MKYGIKQDGLRSEIWATIQRVWPYQAYEDHLTQEIQKLQKTLK